MSNYDPFADFKKYGNPLEMSHADREKRMERIRNDMEAAQTNRGKFVWGEGDITVEMPKEK